MYLIYIAIKLDYT